MQVQEKTKYFDILLNLWLMKSFCSGKGKIKFSFQWNQEINFSNEFQSSLDELKSLILKFLKNICI